MAFLFAPFAAAMAAKAVAKPQATSPTKPELVPGPRTIYVTNKTKDVKQVFVRLRGDKLQESEYYSRVKDETAFKISMEGNAGAGKEGPSAGGKLGFEHSRSHEEELRQKQVFACLTQGGFVLIPPGKVKPFAVESEDKLMYVSVHDGSMIWGTDMPVDPRSYGCVSIKGDENGIEVQPSNPEPVWIPYRSGTDPFPKPTELIKVGVNYKLWSNLYFGRQFEISAPPCEVSFSTGKVGYGMGKKGYNPLFYPPLDKERYICSGAFLKDTGYELKKAERGNKIPPNACPCSSTGTYYGRIGGNYVCKVMTVDGLITEFVPVYYGDEGTTGEVLLLTSDSSE